MQKISISSLKGNNISTRPANPVIIERHTISIFYCYIKINVYT